MSRVALDNVSKSFRDGARGLARAVRDLSLECGSGECLALLGPSGCGKTTTLRLIAGLEEPEAGTIRFDGRSLAGVPPQDRDVAMVFQHFALYPHLNVARNLTLGLQLRGASGAEIEGRLRETADALGLAGLLERRPKELSGGERQRVAIGRAIIRRPKVLLFDEPLSNLDAPLRSQLRAEIATLHRRTGATTLYVTHDQAEAMALAQRIAVLKEGTLQQLATPERIHRRPANLFVASFIGSPPMNLFRGTLGSEGGNAIFQPASNEPARKPWGLPAGLASRLGSSPKAELILGLRPEHFRLAPAGDLSAVVTAVQPLGSETLLSVSWAGLSFYVRLPPGPTPRADELVTLQIVWEEACCFDAVTGNVISEPA